MAAETGLMADDDIVSRAEWARTFGPGQVRTAREDLREDLREADKADDLAILRESPLYKACQVESARSRTDVTREDLLTDKGDQAIAAAKLLESLTDAEKAIRGFELQAGTLIQNLSDTGKKHRAENIRDNALGLARTLSKETVPQFSGILNDTIQSIVKLPVTDQEVVDPVIRIAETWETALVGPYLTIKIPIIIAVRVTLAKILAKITAPIKAAFAQVAVYLPAVLLAFVIMAGAVAVVFSTKYLANPHFGALTDYWELSLAAYGSAQAVAVGAALLLISSPKRWYG
jgi:hypothetical protein